MHGFGTLRSPDGAVAQQGVFDKGQFKEALDISGREDLQRMANKEYAMDRLRKKQSATMLGDGKAAAVN